MTRAHVSTLSEKGQVTIPAELRRALGLEPNDQLVFRIDEDGLRLEKLPLSFEDVFGAVTPLQRPEDWDTRIREAKDERAESRARRRR